MTYKKHCCYGMCNSDSRYPNRDSMKGVWFINFPKPKTQLEKCLRWIKCCGRPHEQFNVDRISKMTFICSKHFVGGMGPTESHPDPIPATASREQLEKARRGCRTRHKHPPTKRKRLVDDDDQRNLAAEALIDLGVTEIKKEISTDSMEAQERDIPGLLEQVSQNDAVMQTVYTKCEQGKVKILQLRSVLRTSGNRLTNTCTSISSKKQTEVTQVEPLLSIKTEPDV